MKLLTSSILLAGAFAALGGIAAAQEPGSLAGGILSGGTPGDKSDIAIILTNTATGETRRLPAAKDGLFKTMMPPGNYRVEVERAGKRQATSQPLVLNANGNTNVELQVDLGPASETVEVEAQAPPLQDDPPDIGRAYQSRIVRSLPVPDRSSQEINGLLSGVSPPTLNFSRPIDPQQGRTLNTNGLPAYANDQLLEGTSVREPFTGILSMRVLPDEAVERLSSRVSNYPAELGHAAGLVANTFTRSGTNGFHGSVFGFFTNDFLSARYGLLPPNVPSPKLHNWQFGATGGGAIIPDKMFFFLSYEGTRRTGFTPQFASVPTAAMLGGNFSGLGVTIFDPTSGNPVTGAGRTAFGGAILPPGRINPSAASLLSALPTPNEPGFANNLVGNVPQILRNNVADGRIDYRFSDALTGFLRYGLTHDNVAEGSIFGTAVGSPLDAGLRNNYGAVGITGNYRGILAELRLGFNRYRNALSPTAQVAGIGGPLATLGFGTSLPPISITGLGALGGTPGIPGRDIDNTWDGTANFHMARGGHQLTFGAGVRSEEANGYENMLLSLYGPAGGFTFGPGPTSSSTAPFTGVNTILARSIASFLLGAPTSAGIVTPTYSPSLHQNQYAAFISDDWHITTRFAINVGLRYEIYGPLEFRQGAGGSLFTAGSPLTSISALNDGNYSQHNFAPRFGLAYRFSEHTVVRGGYAINYFPLPFGLSGFNQAQTATTLGVAGGFGSTSFAVTTVATTSGIAPNTAYYTRSSFHTPYAQNYYLMIQHELPAGFLFDVGYVGSNGRQLAVLSPTNAALPGTGVAGLPFFASGQTAPVTAVTQGLNSRYDSLQTNLTKRLSKGASISLSYTFGKVIDNGSNIINPFANSNRGPADWDRTHVLSIGHLFALPVGRGSPRFNRGFIGQILANWELAGIFRYATGTPFSVTADPTACACPGVTSIFANAGVGASNINGSANIDPTLFSAPSAGTLSNTQGRNSFRGPDFTSYNVSLFKSFTVRENWKVELRGEAYNLFNSTLWANPATNVSLATFGLSTATVNGTGGRLFQLGARVLF